MPDDEKPAAQDETAAQPEPAVQSEPAPKAEPAAETEPAAQAEPAAQSEPAAQPEPAPQTEPAAQTDSEKIGLSFSSRPPLESENKGGSPKSKEAEAGAKAKPALKVIIFAIGVIAILAAGTIWHYTHTKVEPKKTVAKTAAPAPVVIDPSKKFDELTKKINDELSGKATTSAKLYALALERLTWAKKLSDQQKVCKAIDFAAAMADRTGKVDEALTLYDLHNLVKPEQKILEAKFRLYHRFSMTPPTEEEQKLYEAFRTMERAEDDLSSDMTIISDDYYDQMLKLKQARKEQANAFASSNQTYNQLLQSWFLNKNVVHFLSMLFAKQSGAASGMLNYTINQNNPIRDMQQVFKWTEFENTKVYSAQKWYLVLESESMLAYLTTDKKTLVLFKLTPTHDQLIWSARIISLAAISGEQFPDSMFELLAPLVFGVGADEFPESATLLKATMLLTSTYGYKYSWNSFRPLFSKDKLVGFQIDRVDDVDWSKDPSIDAILALLPKEHAIKTKFGDLSYLDNPVKPPAKKPGK